RDHGRPAATRHRSRQRDAAVAATRGPLPRRTVPVSVDGRQRVRRLLPVGLAAAASLLAAAGQAHADTATSSNWSGYAVSAAPTADGTDPVPLSFTSVSGTWVEPAASCTTGANTYAAFWVGLGGFSDTSQALEQIGTEVDCSASNTARHS